MALVRKAYPSRCGKSLKILYPTSMIYNHAEMKKRRRE
jgi:hypothetical protein